MIGRAISQAAWERQCTDLLPAGVVELLRDGHRERIGQRSDRSTSPLYAANQWLLVESRELRAAHVTRAYDEDAIRAHAENYARLCRLMRTDSEDITRQVRQLTRRQEFARALGVEPPAGRSMTLAGMAARLDDPLWWRRQLRKRWTRSAEDSMRALGLVRRGRQPYATDEAVRWRAAQRRREREWMERSELVNEVGEQLPLLDVAERSLANPALRRGEFMCRCRGFEAIAQDLGHSALFVTVTAPSEYHAQLAAGGRNPAYTRAVVRDAQRWLCERWARARAKLKRLAVTFYGFRIAEPHHDGTPHWHLLLFCRCSRNQRGVLRRVLRLAFMTQELATRRAQAARLKVMRIDRTKGSAVGYVAKYVSKNIDGAGSIGDAQDDETGEGVSESVLRVDAWASVHGIRQFQQVGGAPVGLWREARRLRESIEDADIERARAAADRGDWRAFSQAVCGYGYALERRACSLKLHKEETGEQNKYGECRPARVIGLRYASAIAITRQHRWRIERKGCPGPSGQVRGKHCDTRRGSAAGTSSLQSSRAAGALFSTLGPVAITVRGAPAAGDPVVWSNPQETSQAGPYGN